MQQHVPTRSGSLQIQQENRHLKSRLFSTKGEPFPWNLAGRLDSSVVLLRQMCVFFKRHNWMWYWRWRCECAVSAFQFTRHTPQNTGRLLMLPFKWHRSKKNSSPSALLEVETKIDLTKPNFWLQRSSSVPARCSPLCCAVPEPWR